MNMKLVREAVQSLSSIFSELDKSHDLNQQFSAQKALIIAEGEQSLSVYPSSSMDQDFY